MAQKTTFSQKNSRKILSEQKNIVPLHSQKGIEMIEKAMSFLFPDGIVPWCNGNTSDFGSDISSSSLDGITKRKRLSNEFRQPLF